MKPLGQLRAWVYPALLVVFPSFVHSATPQLPLGVGRVIDLPTRVFGLKLADFDRDGRLDFVAASMDSGVVVGMNDGAGSFHLRSIYVSAEYEVGDFDGDGWQDVAVLRDMSHLEILRWSRDSFVSFAAAQLGPSSLLRATGDMDGDGASDIVVFSPSDSTITVWRCADDGIHFATSVPAPRYTSDVAVADLNGDGRTDIAASMPRCDGIDPYFGCMAVHLRSSGGGWFPAVAYPVRGYAHIEAADLDADGRVDLVATGSEYDGGLGIYWNDGGAFARRDDYPTRGHENGSPAFADLDHDGLLDVTVPSQRTTQGESWVQIFLQRNDRTFEGSLSYFTFVDQEYYIARGGSIAIGDVDGDGGLDQVVTQVFHANPVPGYERMLVIPHLDGLAFAGTAGVVADGAVRRVQTVRFGARDEVMMETGVQAYLVHMRNDGTPLSPVPFPEGLGAEVVDLDLDGRSDLVWATDSTITVRRCGPDGTLQPPDHYAGRLIGIDDADGDTKPDLLLRAGDLLAIAANDGMGRFGSPIATDLVVRDAHGRVAFAHIAGPGNPDAAVATDFDPCVAIQRQWDLHLVERSFARGVFRRFPKGRASRMGRSRRRRTQRPRHDVRVRQRARVGHGPPGRRIRRVRRRADLPSPP